MLQVQDAQDHGTSGFVSGNAAYRIRIIGTFRAIVHLRTTFSWVSPNSAFIRGSIANINIYVY